MPRIHSPVGDFDYKITLTNPADSSTKDTESDEIKLAGGRISYYRDGSPAMATLILELNSDSKWIDDLFLVDFETKGADEGTWLNRFTGKVYLPSRSSSNRITLVCLDRTEDRLNKVSAKDRYFFHTLVDRKQYDINWGATMSPTWPPQVVLDADARPIRPLIQVEILDVIGMRILSDEDMDGDKIYGNLWVAQEFVARTSNIYKIDLCAHKFGSIASNLLIDIVEPDQSDPNKPSSNVIAGSSKSVAPGSVPAFPPPPEHFTFGLTLDYSSSPLSVSPNGHYFIRCRTSGGDASNYYGWRNHAWPKSTLHLAKSADGGSSWTSYVEDNSRFRIHDLENPWTPLLEEVDFSVDYPNKKILFDRDFKPPSMADSGYKHCLDMEARASYFKGYHTSDSIVEKIYDDFLSKYVPSKTISPTDTLNLGPFSSREGFVLPILQELLKVGSWFMRLYKNSSGNLHFEFVDAYEPSDWGSSPFTGTYANNRKLYHGDDAALGESDYIRIVSDDRRIAAGPRFNCFRLFNRNARLLIGAGDPVGIDDHGLLSSRFLECKIVDSLDSLVKVIEFLFQYFNSARIIGNLKVDRVSMLTADAMFTHCNDLVFIKDSRLAYDGAHAITGISLDLTDWTFSLNVADKLPPVKFDKLFAPGLGFSLIPDMLDQSAFLSPHLQTEQLGVWLLNTILINVETSALSYNSGYTYKIGVGDSDSPGSTMQNEIANVACEVNESTSKIHTLDIDGDSSDEYRLAVAMFEESDLSPSSWPVTIKEVGLYNGSTLLKRLVLKVPWPGSPASEDFFHPQPTLNRGGKLFVCWVISA